MRNFGINNEISELALNHKPKEVEAIYDVRDDILARIAALELWAAIIRAAPVSRNTSWSGLSQDRAFQDPLSNSHKVKYDRARLSPAYIKNVIRN